ncbi:MAG: hypothetical protein QW424_01760 [Candidatus Bathyarchaeia archaeon]
MIFSIFIFYEPVITAFEGYEKDGVFKDNISGERISNTDFIRRDELAEFGLNRLALNPVTGPRARWVSVITTGN